MLLLNVITRYLHELDLRKINEKNMFLITHHSQIFFQKMKIIANKFLNIWKSNLDVKEKEINWGSSKSNEDYQLKDV